MDRRLGFPGFPGGYSGGYRRYPLGRFPRQGAPQLSQTSHLSPLPPGYVSPPRPRSPASSTTNSHLSKHSSNRKKKAVPPPSPPPPKPKSITIYNEANSTALVTCCRCKTVYGIYPTDGIDACVKCLHAHCERCGFKVFKAVLVRGKKAEYRCLRSY